MFFFPFLFASQSYRGHYKPEKSKLSNYFGSKSHAFVIHHQAMFSFFFFSEIWRAIWSVEMQVSWSTVSTAQEICNGISRVGYSLWSQLGQLGWSVVALAPQSYHQKIIFCPDFEILIFLNKSIYCQHLNPMILTVGA